MTSTIKVNNIQNQCGANIINESSNTITIGASGDTVSLASGASQTGFGRTGTVDWQTSSIKTATFTAANGEGYFCNTTSGSFTVNLPAGSAGAIVSIQDYNNTFDTNSLTVDANGSEKINGGDAGQPVTLSTEGLGITFVYIDSTVGWRSVQSNEYATAGLTPAYISATGGTITTVCTNFKVHTFTGPGTFCVSCAGNASGSNTVSYMVVAGGGGGGGSHGGGGGAGGFREGKATTCSYTASPLNAPAGITIPASGPYSVTVGGGGTPGGAATSGANGGTGGVSTFSTITSAGGGGGATESSGPGLDGGSGGGGTYNPNHNVGGNGNTPPVSPPQGQPGGTGQVQAGPYHAAGGGGAKCAGSDFNSSDGKGGDGQTTSINATPTAFAGGGGAGGTSYCQPGAGAGGTGGGAAGGGPVSAGSAGTVNTGGGGGGGYAAPAQAGGSGGSGIVIIRYKFQ